MATLIQATERTIGITIRFLRLNKELSQGQLAKLAGLRQPVISSMESGSSMTVPNLNKVASALGIESHKLMEAAAKLESKEGAERKLLETVSSLAALLDPEELKALARRAEER